MQKEQDGAMLKAMLVLIFMVVALGFTAYQTAKGYESAIGTVPAWLLAFLCAGILGLLTLSLKTKLSEGGSTIGIWLGCLIVAGVSFAGNFNSFYTGFIKTELIKDELESKRNALEELQTRSNKVLQDRSFLQLERDVIALDKKLSAQIVNDGNPGLGPIAKGIIQEIESKIGPLTPEKGIGKDTKSLEALGKRYSAQIRPMLEAKRVSLVENSQDRLEAENENKKNYETAIGLVDKALSDLAISKTETHIANGVVAIQKAVEANSRIGAKTKGSLPASIVYDYDKKLTLESDKVGSIDFSFNSARKHLNHFAVWLSAFLAFFIDMGVPIVIWLIHGRNDVSLTRKFDDARGRSDKAKIL